MNSLRQVFSPPPNKGGWFRFYANIPMLVLCTVGIMVPTSAEDLFTKTSTVSDGVHTQSLSFSADSLEALFNNLDSATNTILDTYGIFNSNTAAINETTGANPKYDKQKSIVKQ